VVVALTAELHARMQKQRMRKEYLAVVRGTPDPPSGVITLPLARDPDDRRRVVVTDGGAACETRYQVIRERLRVHESGISESIVRCELVTGRTHQIRVHLAAIGCPIVGDETYGAASERIARQALHAWRVSLVHPLTRQRLDLESPIPADIRTFL
jgi:23S rRNA pseudouridine1911/1915/1917 synthase